jgi:hypothetical protein
MTEDKRRGIDEEKAENLKIGNAKISSSIFPNRWLVFSVLAFGVSWSLSQPIYGFTFGSLRSAPTFLPLHLLTFRLSNLPTAASSCSPSSPGLRAFHALRAPPFLLVCLYEHRG